MRLERMRPRTKQNQAHTTHNHHTMADIPLSQIAAARNQILSREQPQPESDRVAAELDAAHHDALSIKTCLAREEGAAPPQQQALPHGGSATMADAAPATQHEAEAKGLGERLAEGVATADQGVTSAVRNTIHAASEGLSGAANKATETAAAAADSAKQAVQGAFASDDPEYKEASNAPAPAAVTLTDELPGGAPTIASPIEDKQRSLGEGSVGVAAGDPAGGANIVAAATSAGKGVMASLKDAFTGGALTKSAGGPPAGPSDPDPRGDTTPTPAVTRNVPVGDFKALKEALAQARDDDTQAARDTSDTTSASANTSSSGSGDASKVSPGSGDPRDAAAAAAGVVSDADAAATDAVVGAARDTSDSVREAVGAAQDKATAATDSPAQEGAAGGPLSSLLQGAKEGFVGAYDAAASALSGATESVKETSTTSSPGPEQPDVQAAPTPTPQAAADSAAGGSSGSGLQSGAIGSGHASAPQASVGAVLKQGWEDLKHGGAKAPHAVSTAGETAAPFDVTSNVERSKHMEDDPQQAKIYEAEVYHVSPGAQASAQAVTDARHGGDAVAGDKREVTGAVPHGKPDGYKVHADAPNRFSGDKGMASGFGTGSAAPWSGDDSIKKVAALFGGASASPDAQAAAETGGSGSSLEGAGSSATGGGASAWVASMATAWRNLGVASAKGPLGKDVAKDITWDNPTQDAVIDPLRGVTKKEGESPGHKIQMRTAEQVPPKDHDVTDPALYKDKAERLGKVVKDSLTTSSDEAAADPTNLKGKSSDNQPDGTEYFLKRELQTAGEGLSHTPAAAGSALSTAAEIATGAAGHVAGKAKELVHNLATHGDIMSADERAAKGQAAVARVEANIEKLGDVATDHRAVQALQEERLATIGNPAHARVTLGDKVIGPLVSDASDPTHAKELADSYHAFKAGDTGGADQPGGGGGHSPLAGSGTTPASSGGASSSSSGRDAGEAAKDTAHAAGERASAAAKESVQDAAAEAHSTAKATGEVVGAEASAGVDTVKGAAHNVAERVSDAATPSSATADRHLTSRHHHSKQPASNAASRVQESARGAADDAKQSTHETAEGAKQAADAAGSKLQEGVDAVAHGAGYAVGTGAQAVDEARDAAARAGAQVGSAAGSLLASVGDGVKTVLGSLLGPYERQGAFDESTAVLTGPPSKDSDPVGAEQLSAQEAAALEAGRAAEAGAGDHGTPGATARSSSIGQPGTTSSTSILASPAPAGPDKVAADVKARAEETAEGAKARLQAGVDDAAHAAGLTAGHIESAVDGVRQQVAHAADKVTEVTHDIRVPPAEIPTNTEDLLRAREAQRQKQQQQ